MKTCPQCRKLFQEQTMRCNTCAVTLSEISLPDALKSSNITALKKAIKGNDLSDEYIQYHIRSYIGNRSLFLDYDIQKMRMKHGPRLKRFLICNADMTAVFNIPWFFFNIITSNLFHAKYTKYCPRCNTKYAPGKHDQEECDYNIEYFNVLDDILTGNIAAHKPIYQEFAREKKQKKWHSAFEDLFKRNIGAEAFWDMTSITLSILFWLFIAVFISWPYAKVLAYKVQHYENYEFGLPVEEFSPH